MDQTVLSMVLAGGQGKRLMPLTLDRAKPAVPFGGEYRLIDFVLSNLVHGGFLRIVVLTQYKSHSLDRHIAQTWRMSPLLRHYVAPVPAQMRRGQHWFAGSADAIYQNLNLIHDERPDHVLVFGADHIYRMDPSQMLDFHLEQGAGVTVAAARQPVERAHQFGVIEPDASGQRVAAFHEKPHNPTPLTDAPDQVYASMGNYIFSTEALVEAVTADAEDEASDHDIGGDIVPRMVKAGDAAVYDFTQNRVPGATERDHAYWRDVGTLDSYYDAHMDLISVQPVFNLYNHRWPILTSRDPSPPAKFVHNEGDRVGRATDSMVSGGVVVSGGDVACSVLSAGVYVHSYAQVDSSVLMSDVRVGRSAVVRNAIIDKDVVVPPHAQVGVDPDRDRERGFTVSDGGVVVIGKNETVEL